MGSSEYQPSMLLKLLLFLTSCAFSLALLETAFHAFAPQPLYAVQNAPWGFQHIPNTSFTHAAEAWFEHRWLAGRDFVTHVQYNSQGFRDYDYGYAKPPHTARVLVLGDSYGEGMEVQFQQTASKVLERDLNAWLKAGNSLPGPSAAKTGRNLAALPPAVGDDHAWALTQLLFRELRRVADTLNSGLLIANVHYPDVNSASEAASKQYPLQELLARGELVPWNERRALLERIGSDTVDVNDWGTPELHYRFDHHWNSAGHSRAADIIFHKIIDSHLLPLGEGIDRVEVINASMSAYSQCKELMLLQMEGAKYQPDLVLVLYTAADERNVADDGMCTPSADGRLAIHSHTFSRRQLLNRAAIGFIKSHSHFLTFVYDRVHRMFGSGLGIQFAQEA